MQMAGLDDVIEKLDEVIAELRSLEPVGAAQFGGAGGIKEALADQLNEVSSCVADLLERARGSAENDWPELREALLGELDRSFEGIREGYGVLQDALEEGTALAANEMEMLLRAAEHQLYWLLRRRSSNG